MLSSAWPHVHAPQMTLVIINSRVTPGKGLIDPLQSDFVSYQGLELLRPQFRWLFLCSLSTASLWNSSYPPAFSHL